MTTTIGAFPYLVSTQATTAWDTDGPKCLATRCPGHSTQGLRVRAKLYVLSATRSSSPSSTSGSRAPRGEALR